MRTLHHYLTRQILAALLLTVAVFTGLLLLGTVLKEVLVLLANGQASLGLVARSILLLIPWVLVFALPMGLLTATLLVFGRLSADHELTAVRAGGVSLVAWVTPVLLLSVVLSGICAVVNLHIGPRSRTTYKNLLLDSGLESLGALLPEKTFIKDFPGRIIYVGRVKGNELEDILVYTVDRDGRVETQFRASEGTLKPDRERRTMTVQLRDVWRVSWREDERDRGVPVHAAALEITESLAPVGAKKRRRLTDMTFLELRQELRQIERQIGLGPVEARPTREQLAARLETLRKQRGDLTLPIRVQMHRQVSFSLACVGFALVGIPLGIRGHRRETTAGVAAALVLVVVYYGFIILGEALETRPEYFPHLIVWVPNFLFQAVGIVLLWRANRGV
ncbi:MAG TPA: LptF/LptG family permease [Methylomirabilota bacterium]|nr:LptF/LptG family permease [Methylomirabilota bacterium]